MRRTSPEMSPSGVGNADRCADLDVAQLIQRNLGLPLNTSVAHKAEQFRARAHHVAHGGAAGRYDTTGHGLDLGVVQIEPRGGQLRFGRGHVGLRLALCREVFGGLLLGDRAAAAELARAVCVGGCQFERGARRF